MRRLAKSARLARTPIYRRGLFAGVAAAIEHESALRGLEVGEIIDVGANKGQFSLVARRLFPDARIHAFEPLGEPFSRFRALFGDDEKTTCHQVALGESPGRATIHISGQADSSSLLPITPLQDHLFPGTKEVATRSIDVARGDDFFQEGRPNDQVLIKLDVQGFELVALSGLQTTLSRSRYVYTEVSFQELYMGQALAHDVIGWLGDRGFRLRGVYNLSTDMAGAPVYADFLFSRA
jgi:FkbM family methyltransferase